MHVNSLSFSKVLHSIRCTISPKEVLCTGLFDSHDMEECSRWQKDLLAAHNRPSSPSALNTVVNQQHAGEEEEYGISSYTFFSTRPFHPQRLWKACHSPRLLCDNESNHPCSILRSKGFFWVGPKNPNPENLKPKILGDPWD
jgi:G3E family GTPase